MPIQAPNIDSRSYEQIVARTQQLANQLTSTTVEATVAALTGRILDEDIVQTNTSLTSSVRALREPGSDPVFVPGTPTDDGSGVAAPVAAGTGSSDTTTTSTTGNIVVAAAGTIVDATLAQQISLVRGANGRVRVRGWHPPGRTVAVVPTLATLIGQTLGETIINLATSAVVAPAGAVVTEPLARAIIAERGTQVVSIVTGADVGDTLIRIFGRMVDLAIQRINAAPDKNFLAFLDLIGTRLQPPQAARVPLTFRLAPSATSDVLLRARTPVAAPPNEQELDAIVFETERDLWLTAVQLASVLVRTPSADRYGDYTAAALGTLNASYPAFTGDQLIEHSLYMARADFFLLPGNKTIALTFTTPDAPWLAALPLVWSYWDGLSWQTLSPISTSPSTTTWRVSFTNPPTPASIAVDGRSARWIRARLQSALPWGQVTVTDAVNAITTIRRQELAPSDVFAGNKRLDLTVPFFPFGTADAPTTYFYVNTTADPTFMRPGSQLTIAVALQTAGVAASGMIMTWEYGSGTSSSPTWSALGRSSASNVSLDGGGFSDGTQGLTRNGAINFPIPAQWTQRPFQNVNGYWLRIGVSSGGYGTSPNIKPPQIQSLQLTYDWALPRIQGISANVLLERTAIKPDASFASTQPLDLSKDFYPFGERPRFNDVFYLASGEVIGKPGADVTLRITISNPNPTLDATRPNPPTPPLPVLPSSDLELAWEVWSNGAWVEVGRSSRASTTIPSSNTSFADNTKALTTNSDGASGTVGTVRLRLPASTDTTTVNGVSNFWLRVRIAKGNYGIDAYYNQQTDGSYRIVLDTFRPPVIRELRLEYRLDQTKPLSDCLAYNDFSAVDRTQEAAEGGAFFLPFMPTGETRPTLYLGFDRPFANRTATLYTQVEPPLFNQISQADQPAQPAPARIVWEYYGAGGWTRLGVRDETRAFAERGLLLFVGPADARPRAEFGRTQYWLRARWDSGLFRVAPRLRRVLTNTTWATQSTTIEQELLGSSDGSPGQLFRTARAPVLLGQTIEVFEREPPSAAERAAIEALEGADALTPDQDQPQGIWLRWHAVDDFYSSGPRDRHYVFDHINGELRFGDGQHGLVPPRGRNNLRARYQLGGGVRGNLPAGTINQLKSSVPYVAGAVNLEPATSGAEQETLDQLKQRGPRALRHHNRAVTAQDFEDLALLTCPDVARARALTPAFDPTRLLWLDPAQPVAPAGGSADHLAVSAGRVEVIIVPRSTVAQPTPDLDLVTRVEEQLRAHADPTARLWISGPDWLVVRINVQIVPTSLEAGDALGATIDRALQRYLHPLTGLDGSGWEFGRRPYPSDLYAFIERMPGVDHVQALTIDSDTPDPSRLDRFLVCSGQHQVSVVSPDQGD